MTNLYQVYCVFCKKPFLNKRKVRKKACSRRCNYLYNTKKNQARAKRKRTMRKKYGSSQKAQNGTVSSIRASRGSESASKTSHTPTPSKGQRELYEALCGRLKTIDKSIEIVLEEEIFAAGKLFFADIFIKSHNIIIEYHGDFYHCNPLIYEQNFFHPVKRTKAKTIWNRDAKRKRLIETAGYEVLVVWENDFSNNQDKVIVEVVDEVKKKLKKGK